MQGIQNLINNITKLYELISSQGIPGLAALIGVLALVAMLLKLGVNSFTKQSQFMQQISYGFLFIVIGICGVVAAIGYSGVSDAISSFFTDLISNQEP